MDHESEASDEPTYGARNTRLLIHIDWYLYSALQPEGLCKRWTLEEIQNQLKSMTGIKPRKSTILRRNSKFFQKYQCSPLHRVDQELYALNPVYFSVASEKVRSPPAGPGRPRKKYTKDEKSLDYQI